MTRLLSRSDVAGVLQMTDAIEIMAAAFSDLAGAAALMPQRTPIPVPDHAGLALFMPAYLKGMGALGAKIVTVYKDNPARYQVPTIMGTVLLLEERTGAPLAVMDGGFLTAMRTGAVSGLATRLLARKDAHVHTLFGTGGMARAQAWAVDCVRDIDRLILVSVDPIEEREEFAASLGSVIRCPIVQAESPRQAVEEADVVTLITSSRDPVVDGAWFRQGAHINAIGAHAPTTRELDAATLSRSKVVCDLVEACMAEAGDFLIPAERGEWNWDRVHGSLGDVVIGKRPGRESDDEITLFKSVGLAIQDISTAQHVFARAAEMGVGTEFEFGG